MRETMWAALLGAAVAGGAGAQERQPGRPAQPAPERPAVGARTAQLEEEAEVLEAERDVKKAQARVAEVAVRALEKQLVQMKAIIGKGLGSSKELDQIEFEFEATKVQLEVRLAELKVIEVRVKYAKKRLADAKAVPERRPEGPRPEPRPERPLGGVEEVKAKLAKVRDEVAAKAAEAKRAEALLKVADDDLAKLRDAATKGRVRAGAIEALEAKVVEAKELLTKRLKEHKALEEEAAALEKKVKEIEK